MRQEWLYARRGTKDIAILALLVIFGVLECRYAVA